MRYFCELNSISDAGMFAYVDPRYQVRTVEYVADAQGFHPVLSNPVADTPTVAAAKAQHADLYARIAAEHARIAAERDPEQEHLNWWRDFRSCVAPSLAYLYM